MTAISPNYSLGASLDANRPSNFLTIMADFTQPQWNTIGTHRVFSTNGSVRMRIIPYCASDLNSSGGSGQISFGITGFPAIMIPTTSCTAIDQGEMWLTTSPQVTYNISALIDSIINGPKGIGFEVSTEALNAGQILFNCWWEPLDNMGSVSLGNGSGL